jgi:hypothetical protein
MEAIFLSILIEHQKALDALHARLAPIVRKEGTSPDPRASRGQDGSSVPERASNVEADPDPC